MSVTAVNEYRLFLILFMFIFDYMHLIVTYLIVHSCSVIMSKNTSVSSCCDVGAGGGGGGGGEQYVLLEWGGFNSDRHCGTCWCTGCRPTGHRLVIVSRPVLVAVVAASLSISGWGFSQFKGQLRQVPLLDLDNPLLCQ